jgi:hypothetical protein
MRRYAALWRDTWWLWLSVLIGGGGLAVFEPVFLVTVPICIFAFVYFGLMRYDENGKPKGDSDK